MLLASVVDWNALGQVVLVSLGIGVGLTLSYSLAILGLARFSEMRRDGRSVVATGFALLATIGLTACAAAVALGIVELTSKS